MANKPRRHRLKGKLFLFGHVGEKRIPHVELTYNQHFFIAPWSLVLKAVKDLERKQNGAGSSS